MRYIFKFYIDNIELKQLDTLTEYYFQEYSELLLLADSRLSAKRIPTEGGFW
jgi:hypothetical protein